MSIELGKLILDDETALAFSVWLDGLVRERRRDEQRLANEEEQDQLASQRADKLVEIARAVADEQGPIPGMLPVHQAGAAYASWFDSAGYADVDEHFEPDDSDQELWEQAYANRLDELRRARKS